MNAYFTTFYGGTYCVVTWNDTDRQNHWLTRDSQRVMDLTSVYHLKQCKHALNRLPDSLDELKALVTLASI